MLVLDLHHSCNMNIPSLPHQLHSEAEFDSLLAAPGPQWLLKHSNTCGISQAAYDEVTNFMATHVGQQVGMIVVQEHRPLSNLVANRLKYVHQSPQLFLLCDGKVAWSATHWSITAAAMAAALTKVS
jgi:bacillithiol system protein YtxJ